MTNPLSNSRFARWPWAALVFAIGAVGAELVVFGLLVAWTIAGVDLWSDSAVFGYFGVTVFCLGSIAGLVWAALLGAFAVVGGAIGRAFGKRGELLGVGFAPLLLVALWAALFPLDFYSAFFIGGGGVATAAWVLMTYWYRAIPPESAESKRARKLAAQLAAGEGES
jgi:hypothetical protein